LILKDVFTIFLLLLLLLLLLFETTNIINAKPLPEAIDLLEQSTKKAIKRVSHVVGATQKTNNISHKRGVYSIGISWDYQRLFKNKKVLRYSIKTFIEYK